MYSYRLYRGGIKLENSIIYFRQKESESLEDFMKKSDIFISNIKHLYTIKAVFADSHNDRSQLYSFINSPPKSIDVLIIDHYITDEFDQRLLDEISRMENFRIEYAER
jgi:hypothetical protein